MAFAEKPEGKKPQPVSLEDAFAEGEASLRLEGMEPGPAYYAVKQRVLRGEITFDEAVAIIMSLKPEGK